MSVEDTLVTVLTVLLVGPDAVGCDAVVNVVGVLVVSVKDREAHTVLYCIEIMILIPIVSVEETLVTVVTVLSVGVDAVVCDTVVNVKIVCASLSLAETTSTPTTFKLQYRTRFAV